MFWVGIKDLLDSGSVLVTYGLVGVDLAVSYSGKGWPDDTFEIRDSVSDGLA